MSQNAQNKALQLLGMKGGGWQSQGGALRSQCLSGKKLSLVVSVAHVSLQQLCLDL